MGSNAFLTTACATRFLTVGTLRSDYTQLQPTFGKYKEAERAARQFDAVEPENRLVVRTLERRWNEKLQQLAELEQAYAEARQVQRLELSQAQRQQILRLAKDIPAIWHSPTTTPQERKEILGLLVRASRHYPCGKPDSPNPHCYSLAYGGH
jgi:hypothetical protein